MADLALRWNGHAGDLVLEADDLVRDDGLETAVILSLFVDRRADAGDILPDGGTDRRGWWGDAAPPVAGDRIGSRLWLLSREKERGTALRRAEEYAREALQWLVDDRVAERVEVDAQVPRTGVLGLAITIHRPRKDPVQYRFDLTWSAQQARR
jgi:phage gp46-like protein